MTTVYRLMNPEWIAYFNRSNEAKGAPWRYRVATSSEVQANAADLIGAGNADDVVAAQYFVGGEGEAKP